MITPNNTEVRLLSDVPFNNSYEHTRYFSSSAEQTAYFDGFSGNTFLDFTYQREEQAIRVPAAYDSLYLSNYIMYKNHDFQGKWFFGFITHKEYVNPGMTKIYFELDVFQTWLFEMNWKPSFVVREHTKRWNDDGTPVINTVDEELNYGAEYKTVSVTQFVPFTDVFFLVIVCKNRMDTNGTGVEPTVNGGIQPLTYYVHPFKMDGSVPSITVDGMAQTLSPVKDVLKALYKNTSAVNNIVSLYITEYIGHDSLAFPMTKFEPVNIQDGSTNFVTLYVKDMQSYDPMEKALGDKYTGFTSVTESKLLMHPYTITVLTDLKGNHQEIKNEYIQDKNLTIKTKGSIGTSNKVSYHAANYLMDETNLPEAGETAISRAVINNNPNDVPIITDLLSAYLQGNRNQLQIQTQQTLFNGVFGALGNIMTANPAGVVAGGGNAYFEVQGMLAKTMDIQNTPPQLTKMGGNTAFDYGNDIKGLYIIKKEITDEYRKKLTDFFKLYGYKVNELKQPSFHTRQHFNFIQTIGANIQGNIPNDDLSKLKTVFDKGITLWHTDDVGNYNLANGEL